MNHFDSWWRCIHHFIICTCAKLLKTCDRLGSAQCLQYIPLYCQASRILQQSPTAGLWISYSKGICTQQAQPFFYHKLAWGLQVAKSMWDFWGYGYGYFHPARMEMEKGCYQQKFAEANQVLRNSKFTWSGQAQTDLQPASGNSKFTSSLGWHVSMQQKSIVLLIITPPPLWLHKKSLPWWVFSARSDKSSVAGAYILHLRKILRLLPLAVNQQSWHLDLSKSARPNVKYDFEFFTLWVSVL